MKGFLIFFLLPFVAKSAWSPPEVSSADGSLNITLTIDWVTSLNGSRIAPGYNGLPVGPTIRVKPGDILRVTLVNNLPNATALDKELYEYVLNPNSDYVNVSSIFNRLDSIGNVPYASPDPPTGQYFGHW